MVLSRWNGDIDESITMIKSYYETIRKVPQIYTKYDPALPEIQHILKHIYCVHLPPTPDGQLVLYFAFQDPNPKSIFFNSAAACGAMTLCKFLLTFLLLSAKLIIRYLCRLFDF